MYPAARSCLSVVLPLCTHPTNSNGVICVDLTQDPQDLIELKPEELHHRIFTSRDQLGDEVARIPLKTIHINRCPAIAPLTTLKGQENRLDVQVESCLANLSRLQRVSGIVEKIQEVFRRNDFAQTDDPDLMLYQGDFFSDTDRETMNEVRCAEPENLSTFEGSFQDPRLPEMLFRYRARNYPESLDEEEKNRWDQYRLRIFSSSEGPGTRLSQIAELREQRRGADCLDDLELYLLELKQGLKSR
jgi:exodeoxyribonuclease-1